MVLCIGQAVLAYFHDGWYNGRVLNIKGDMVDVGWADDNTMSTLPAAHVQAFPTQPVQTLQPEMCVQQQAPRPPLGPPPQPQANSVPPPPPPPGPPPNSHFCGHAETPGMEMVPYVAQQEVRNPWAAYSASSCLQSPSLTIKGGGGGWSGKHLRKAAQDDNIDNVLHCLTSGTPVDDRDGSGRTALFRAAGHGCYRIAQLLLERNADPNANDKNGGRPVDEAEYWIGKCAVGKAQSLNFHNLCQTLELIRLWGGLRCERRDPYASRRLQLIEREAQQCGLGAASMPWLQPQRPALMPPGPVFAGTAPAAAQSAAAAVDSDTESV